MLSFYFTLKSLKANTFANRTTNMLVFSNSLRNVPTLARSSFQLTKSHLVLLAKVFVLSISATCFQGHSTTYIPCDLLFFSNVLVLFYVRLLCSTAYIWLAGGTKLLGEVPFVHETVLVGCWLSLCRLRQRKATPMLDACRAHEKVAWSHPAL